MNPEIPRPAGARHQPAVETTRPGEPLVWSPSRAEALEFCLRSYYYRYHLAPAGRRGRAGRAGRLVHELNCLVGTEAWMGQVVHELIEHAIGRWRLGREPFEGDLEQYLVRLLRLDHRESALWFSPENYLDRTPSPLLEAHYYDGLDDRSAARTVREGALKALRLFLESELGETLRNLPADAAVELEKWDLVELLPGIHSHLRVDLAYRRGDRVVVIDWKTGRPTPIKELRQGGAYRLAVAQRLQRPLEEIEAHVVRLRDSVEMTQVARFPAEMDDVVELIQESHDRMVELAEPEPGEELPPPERFPPKPHAAFCSRCCFRAICPAAASALAEWPPRTIRDPALEELRSQADQGRTG